MPPSKKQRLPWSFLTKIHCFEGKKTKVQSEKLKTKMSVNLMDREMKDFDKAQLRLVREPWNILENANVSDSDSDIRMVGLLLHAVDGCRD